MLSKAASLGRGAIKLLWPVKPLDVNCPGTHPQERNSWLAEYVPTE